MNPTPKPDCYPVYCEPEAPCPRHITPAEAAEQAAYEAWEAAQEAERAAQCGREHITGPAHDPYGVTCDLPTGHDGRHEGVIMDDHRIKWGARA